MKQRYRHRSGLDIKVPIDAKVMPVTGETAGERLAHGLPLFGTLGQMYVESRAIPVAVAHDAGVLFDPDWNGRPAVIAPMTGLHHELCSVHGRYLQQYGYENKMLTIGPGGGVLDITNGLDRDIVIIAEGLFDVLSLAVCGYHAIATVGRKAPWLPQACKGKTVFLAFDGNRPGEMKTMFYKHYLDGAGIHRLTPPGHSKDWNTALVKLGKSQVEQWVNFNLRNVTTSNTTAV